MQLKSFFQNEIVNFPHVITHSKCIFCDGDKIAFIFFDTSSGFFFQFEPCIIYYFHV